MTARGGAAKRAIADAAVAELAAELAARGIPAEMIRGAFVGYLGAATAEGGTAAEMPNCLRDLAAAIESTLAMVQPKGRA